MATLPGTKFSKSSRRGMSGVRALAMADEAGTASTSMDDDTNDRIAPRMSVVSVVNVARLHDGPGTIIGCMINKIDIFGNWVCKNA